MGDLLDMRAGNFIAANQISVSSEGSACVPCYGGNGLRGYVEKCTHSGDLLLIGRQGALCGNVHRTRGQIYATEHAIVGQPVNDIDVNWAFHMLTALDLNQYATKSAQPGLAVQRISQLEVPVPPSEVQEEIAEILDKFDALVNDISVGLPAELNARRQQYEYYRDRLLTFEAVA